MKKKTKSRLIDVLVVLLCLSVSGTSLFLFWKDLNSSSGKDGEVIGIIEYKYKVAQRKFADRVVWERLQQKSPLYNADTVRTADGALAQITFEDKSVIEIHENTMIQIFYSENEGTKLSVAGGNISVDTTNSDSNLSVAMSNGSVFKLSSGSKLTAVSDSASGENSFQIQAGNASVINKDGTEEKVQIGESVKVNSSGEVKKESLTVTSISSNMKVLNFGENDEKNVPVDIVWTTSDAKSSEPVIIETSFDKDFKKIRDTYTKTGSDSVEVETPEGHLYWRVYAQNNKEEAVKGKITVENVDKPKLTSPVNGSEFKYRDELPSLNFSWEGSDYADKYKLEIINDEGKVIEKEIYAQDFSVKDLSAGEYKWRVVPHYAVNEVGYGEPSEYNVFEIARKETVTPPVPTVPADNAKIVLGEAGSDVAFRWKSEVKTGDYTVTVSKDPDFKQVVYEGETVKKGVSRTFDKDTLPEGEYYWKVVRQSSEEEKPAESEVRKFQILKPAPVISGESKLVYPPDNFMVEKENLSSTDFIWKVSSDLNGQTSTLEFSLSSDFSGNVIKINTEETLISNVKLPASGKYYWRVKTESPDSDGKNGISDVRTLTLLEPLSKPVITSPKNSSLLTVYGEKTVPFKWNAVSGADYYKVKVTESQSGKIVKDFTQKSNGINLKLPAQKYKVSVQAFSDETELCAFRAGSIAETSFSLRNPDPVTLVYPVKNQKVSGIDAVHSPVILNWNYGDKADSAQLIVKKMQSDGSYKTVVTKNDSLSGKYEAERLSPGNYQWQVKASSKDGMILDSKIENFTITSIPELEKAVLIEPENQMVMDAKYLRKHRTITFDWKNVEGATDYSFVIYQQNTNGTLRKVFEQKNIKNTEVKIRDLSVLDIGKFEWRVTAYCHAKDGFEEQKSRQSIGTFDIKFDMPGKVQIDDPGTQYGE